MTQFFCKRTILFGDCDPAGIIYTPRVAYFVVEAAHEFISHSLGVPGLRAILAMGILPPARALSIEFLAPMVWDDEIDIAVSCRDIKTSSFTFFVEARNKAGEITFRATFTQVCVSPKSHRPVAIPAPLLLALKGGPACG